LGLPIKHTKKRGEKLGEMARETRQEGLRKAKPLDSAAERASVKRGAKMLVNP